MCERDRDNEKHLKVCLPQNGSKNLQRNLKEYLVLNQVCKNIKISEITKANFYENQNQNA